MYLLCMYVILCLVSGLRGYLVGGDLGNYLPLFSYIGSHDYSNIISTYDKYGWIFKTYIYLIGFISNNSTLYLIFLSIPIISAPIFLIKKYSKIPWLSVFLYVALGYYTNTFNSVRSSLSLALGIYGVIAIYEKKNLLAIFLLLVATEIHKTILPIFIIFFLKDLHPKYSISIGCILISVLIAHLIPANSILNMAIAYNSDYNAVTFDSMGKGYSLLLLDCLISIFGLILVKRRPNKLNIFLLNIFLLATCLQAFTPLLSFFTRVAYFFSIYVIILLPNLIYYGFKQSSRWICVTVLSALSLVYFQVFTMTPNPQFDNSNSQKTIPYYFYWEKKS